MTAAPATGGLPGYAEHFDAPEGYLDFGRYGPPSRDVLDATADALGRSARAGHDTVDELMLADARARESAARLAGARAEHTVLLPNTSLGLFHAAFGLPGGTVLVPEGEFPANRYPWLRAAGIGRARPRVLTPDAYGRTTADVVRAALTPDVVALSVSAVDFRTGRRADLAALREVLGPDRLLVVDGIQGFGAAELPWQAADVLVVGGQKWLRAGWSTGFAVLGERALDRLEPVLTGWTGVEEPGLFDDVEHPPAAGAGRWSVTNLSPVAAAALAAALGLLERTTVRAVEAHISGRVQEIIDAVRAHGGEVLSPTDPAERAGIVSFRVPGTAPATVAKALHAYEVTPTVRTDSLRLSPHASTPAGAVERVRAALGSLR